MQLFLRIDQNGVWSLHRHYNIVGKKCNFAKQGEGEGCFNPSIGFNPAKYGLLSFLISFCIKFPIYGIKMIDLDAFIMDN